MRRLCAHQNTCFILQVVHYLQTCVTIIANLSSVTARHSATRPHGHGHTTTHHSHSLHHHPLNLQTVHK